MDPEHNTKTRIDDDWDKAYEYAKELGMAFPDLQSLKKRMRRWRLVLKGYRDESHDTGKGRLEVIIVKDLDEGEAIFDWLWFGQKLGERLNAKVRRLLKQLQAVHHLHHPKGHQADLK